MSTNLMSASSQLMNRPADEHNGSFQQLLAAAARDQRNHREVVAPLSSMEVVADDGQLLLSSKRVAGAAYPMTSHSVRALCTEIGARPEFLLGKVSPKVAAIAMSDALSRVSTPVKLLIGTFTGADGTQGHPLVRALTSPTYARVSDYEVLTECDRWLIGAGYQPAKPTKNTDAQQNNILGHNKPCLFRGDRDSFAFFMHTEEAAGAGDRPIRRGVVVESSEVGASSIWVQKFIFDDLCANFIIWGAREMTEFRGIHRGDPRKLARNLREQLRLATPAVTAKELEVLRAAAEKAFAPDVESAVDRLIREFEMSESSAKAAVMLAAANENRGVDPLSFAGVGNGVTSLAKSSSRAGQLVEVATLGGRIYEAASL